MAIPAELMRYAQWCVWKREEKEGRETKIPYDPRTGFAASVTNPTNWSDYNTAHNMLLNGGSYDGLGFVLTKDDPFIFMDLDSTADLPVEKRAEAIETQKRIFAAFGTYAEISPSGQGLHLIARGKLAGQGRRRNAIEIYDTARYMTMTGNTFAERENIIDCQPLIDILYEEMGRGAAVTYYSGSPIEVADDAEIVQRSEAALNGEKFQALWKGAWQDLGYASQSEADFALMDILAFYTQNRTQLSRLFRASVLGQRGKAQRDDYISWMIHKSFDRMLPLVDIELLRQRIDEQLAAGIAAQSTEAISGTGGNPAALSSIAQSDIKVANLATNPAPIAAHHVAKSLSVDGEQAIAQTPAWPQGLLGEIAAFIYAAAPHPVYEIALAGAIGLMSGICGKGWNVNGTGLNTYTLLLARTGTGKEAMASGIDRLMAAVTAHDKAGLEFRGPSQIKSQEALIKYLDVKSSCFLSILGEFGLYMKQLSAPNANLSLVGMRSVIQDLYNKSGKDQIYKPMIYSKMAESTKEILAPAFSILGESTPEIVYEQFEDALAHEGFLPRFLIIEYKGKRPPTARDHYKHSVPPSLLTNLVSLCATAKHLIKIGMPTLVRFTEDADALERSFDTYCTERINDDSLSKMAVALWTRAAVKAFKLAALCAVGINWQFPIITVEQYKWATDLVYDDIFRIDIMSNRGELGGNTFETKQRVEMIRALKFYVEQPYERVSGYGVSREMHASRAVVPYGYLHKKLCALACYRNDKQTSTKALEQVIKNFTSSGELEEIGKSQLIKEFGYNGKAFAITNRIILG